MSSPLRPAFSSPARAAPPASLPKKSTIIPEGASYVQLLRWLWTFLQLPAPASGRALADGRIFLSALGSIVPRVVERFASYQSAVAGGAEGDSEEARAERYALLGQILAEAGVSSSAELATGLRDERFEVVESFLRTLHSAAVRMGKTEAVVKAPRSPTNDSPSPPIKASRTPGSARRSAAAAAAASVESIEADRAIHAADAADDAAAADDARRRLSRGLHWTMELVARELPGSHSATVKTVQEELLQISARPAAEANERVLEGAAPRLASTGQLYILVCEALFNVPMPNFEAASAEATHRLVLQVLAARGHQPADGAGHGAGSLAERLAKPIYADDRAALGDHTLLLECLIQAYGSKVQPEAIIGHVAVLRGSADGLPGGQHGEVSDALAEWMRAVSAKFDHALVHARLQSSQPRKSATQMPHVDNAVEAFCDGVSLPALFAFYQPKLVPFSSLRIAAGDSASIASNWSLVRRACPMLRTGLELTTRLGPEDEPWVKAFLVMCYRDWVENDDGGGSKDDAGEESLRQQRLAAIEQEREKIAEMELDYNELAGSRQTVQPIETAARDIADARHLKQRQAAASGEFETGELVRHSVASAASSDVEVPYPTEVPASPRASPRSSPHASPLRLPCATDLPEEEPSVELPEPAPQPAADASLTAAKDAADERHRFQQQAARDALRQEEEVSVQQEQVPPPPPPAVVDAVEPEQKPAWAEAAVADERAWQPGAAADLVASAKSVDVRRNLGFDSVSSSVVSLGATPAATETAAPAQLVQASVDSSVVESVESLAPLPSSLRSSIAARTPASLRKSIDIPFSPGHDAEGSFNWMDADFSSKQQAKPDEAEQEAEEGEEEDPEEWATPDAPPALSGEDGAAEPEASEASEAIEVPTFSVAAVEPVVEEVASEETTSTADESRDVAVSVTLAEKPADVAALEESPVLAPVPPASPNDAETPVLIRKITDLERERNLMKLEMEAQRRQFEAERAQWQSQRTKIGQEVLAEVYQQLNSAQKNEPQLSESPRRGEAKHAGDDDSEDGNDLARTWDAKRMAQSLPAFASPLRAHAQAASRPDTIVDEENEEPEDAPREIEVAAAPAQSVADLTTYLSTRASGESEVRRSAQRQLQKDWEEQIEERRSAEELPLPPGRPLAVQAWADERGSGSSPAASPTKVTPPGDDLLNTPEPAPRPQPTAQRSIEIVRHAPPSRSEEPMRKSFVDSLNRNDPAFKAKLRAENDKLKAEIDALKQHMTHAQQAQQENPGSQPAWVTPPASPVRPQQAAPASVEPAWVISAPSASSPIRSAAQGEGVITRPHSVSALTATLPARAVRDMYAVAPPASGPPTRVKVMQFAAPASQASSEFTEEGGHFESAGAEPAQAAVAIKVPSEAVPRAAPPPMWEVSMGSGAQADGDKAERRKQHFEQNRLRKAEQEKQRRLASESRHQQEAERRNAELETQVETVKRMPQRVVHCRQRGAKDTYGDCGDPVQVAAHPQGKIVRTRPPSATKPKPRHMDGSVYRRGERMPRKSNRQIIKNSINFCCLAGYSRQDERQELLAEIDGMKGDVNFVVLLKASGGTSMPFRGVYCTAQDSTSATKLWGTGPEEISSDVLAGYYKFDSGSKTFKEQRGVKQLSGGNSDACTLLSAQRLRMLNAGGVHD